MINEATENKRLPQPYLHEYYNIHKFDQADSDVRAPVRIVNSLINALNEKINLPHFLVVVMDADILADLNVFDKNIHKDIRKIITWITKQINIQIRQRRLELMARRPGAVYGSDPTVIFVRMIRRVNMGIHLQEGSTI